MNISATTRTGGWVLTATVLGILWMTPAAARAGVGGAPQKDSPDCTKSGCHEPLLKKKSVHQPLTGGKCDACHQPADAKNHKFKLVADEPDLCRKCHEKTAKDLKFVHGPVSAGTCTPCHDSHGSDQTALLRSEPVTLCLDCHDTMKAALKAPKSLHVPVKRDCGECHQAHGGDQKFFLRLPSSQLCLDCHDPIGKIVKEGPVKHPAVSDADGSCLKCHAAHASDHEKLITGDVTAKCLSCHNRDQNAAGAKVPNIAQLVKSQPNVHGPIRQGECTSCHAQVHGGKNRALLLNEYSADFYVPYDDRRYGLCLECHEAGLTHDKTTRSATNFRNGDVNLHFVHVNRAQKGRNCRICHEMHAGPNPRLVNDSVAFGSREWRLPIGFKKTDGGGSCAPGCHKPYAYERDKPVMNLESRPAN